MFYIVIASGICIKILYRIGQGSAMNSPFDEFSNIFYQSVPETPWCELCESVFLYKVFRELSKLMGERFCEFNFLVISSTPIEDIPRNHMVFMKPTIAIVLSDERGVLPVSSSEKFLMIFKCYISSDLPDLKIYSFPLGYDKDVPEIKGPDISQRKYGIFFSGNLNKSRISIYCQIHPVLKHLPKRIAQNLARGSHKLGLPWMRYSFLTPDESMYILFSDKFKGGLSPLIYAEMLANSKIVLCPRGFVSSETFRLTEALRAGCVVISEGLPSTCAYENSPIISVRDWADGLEVAHELLAAPKKLKAIQEQSILFYKNRLSELATAKYVYSKLIG